MRASHLSQMTQMTRFRAAATAVASESASAASVAPPPSPLHAPSGPHHAAARALLLASAESIDSGVLGGFRAHVASGAEERLGEDTDDDAFWSRLGGGSAAPPNSPRSSATALAATAAAESYALPTEPMSAATFREAALLRISRMRQASAARQVAPGGALASALASAEATLSFVSTAGQRCAAASPPPSPSAELSTSAPAAAAAASPTARSHFALHRWSSSGGGPVAAETAPPSRPTPPHRATAGAMPPSPYLPPSRGPDTLTHIYQGIASMRTLLSAMGWGVETSTGFVSGPPQAATTASVPALQTASPASAPYVPPADALHATAAALARSGDALPAGLSATEAAVRQRALRNAALPRPRAFQVGQWIDALDTVGSWLEATVLAYEERADGRGRVFITYNGWPSRWDEWIDADSPRLAPFRVHSVHATLRHCASPLPFNALIGGPELGPPARPLTPAAWARPPLPRQAELPAAPGAAMRVPWPTVDPRADAPFGGRPRVVVPFGGSAIGMALHEDDPRAALPAVSDAAGFIAQLLERLTAVATSQIESECRRSISVATGQRGGGGGSGPEGVSASAGAGTTSTPPPSSSRSVASTPVDLSDLGDPRFSAPSSDDAPTTAAGSDGQGTAPPPEGEAAPGADASAAAEPPHFPSLTCPEDRVELGALARQLAPLLDRFGRVLTDLAPFVEAMGRVPTFVPAAIRVVPNPENEPATAPPAPAAAATDPSPLVAAINRYVAASAAAASSRAADAGASGAPPAPSALDAALARYAASSAALSERTAAAAAARSTAAAAAQRAAAVAETSESFLIALQSQLGGSLDSSAAPVAPADAPAAGSLASIMSTIARVREQVARVRTGTAALRGGISMLAGALPAAPPLARHPFVSTPALRSAIESQYTGLVQHPPPIAIVQAGQQLPISSHGVSLAALLQGLPPADALPRSSVTVPMGLISRNVGAGSVDYGSLARASYASPAGLDRVTAESDESGLATPQAARELVSRGPAPVAAGSTLASGRSSAALAAVTAAADYVPVTETINFSPGRGPQRSPPSASPALLAALQAALADVPTRAGADASPGTDADAEGARAH